LLLNRFNEQFCAIYFNLDISSTSQLDSSTALQHHSWIELLAVELVIALEY
jgi:hypothetical protein